MAAAVRVVSSVLALCLLGVFVPTASAATIFTIGDSDPYYMGFMSPSEPSGESDEAGRINLLRGLAADPSVPDPTFVLSSGITLERSDNTLCHPTCETALITGSTRGGNNVATGDFGDGFLYLLGKYNGPQHGNEVWYVGGLTGAFTLPSAALKLGGDLLPERDRDGNLTGKTVGLSHWTLYNPCTDDCDFEETGELNPVPEPATLTMLGLGLAGLAARARRRMRKQQN